MKKLNSLIFFLILIIYEEIIFSFLVFNSISANLVYIVLFSIPVAIIIHLLCSIFNNKVNAVLTYLFTSVLVFIFCAQLIYFKIYQSIISFFSFSNGGQVLQFADMIIKTVFDNYIGILLFFLPLFALIILTIFSKISFEKTHAKTRIIEIACFVVVQVLAICTVNFIPQTELYSAKNLYYNVHAPLLTSEKFGVFTTMRLDLQRLIFGFEEKSIVPIEDDFEQEIIPTPEEEVIEYNKIDIDFDKLIENETDSSINKLHKYFNSQEPTEKNIYTGKFKGKNLVVFVAEAFSSLAIREDVTPTLYKLYSEGFQFDNFYTPIFPVSTADGEYIADTSLIPKEGVWSISEIGNNYMPYSYANAFKKLGYTTNAYHNHTYNYYDRDLYIKAMGYDSYLAKGTGLEERMNCSRWPNSDYEMIKATVNDYINNDNFVAYYMTVSGHLNYTTLGNYIANKNWDLVEDLPYSDKAKCYLATQIELDRAIEELINSLEKAGKLEDTVIAISSDHYPYGLTLSEINELSDYKRDDTFEKYHMPFLLWNSEMEEPVKVEKIGSSLDILPTILNLFGIEYDSRLLMGTDILSTSNPLVIFSNRSFITDKGKYNAVKREFYPFNNTKVDDEYVEKINSEIYNKYQMSRLILEKDYYGILKKNGIEF